MTPVLIVSGGVGFICLLIVTAWDCFPAPVVRHPMAVDFPEGWE